MSEQTKKINKILLIGNGFDLRTGVKTTFKEFFRFVTYGVIWHNFNKSEFLKYYTSFYLPREMEYEQYLSEKINNQVRVIADIQREEERKNWEKEHKGEELYPSKHPLEILLEIEKEEKNKKEEQTVFDYCRKLIDTEFGQKFFKYILDCDFLTSALRITLTGEKTKDEMSILDHLLAIYGVTNEKPGKNNDYIPKDAKLGEGLETITHIFEANFEQKRKNIALWSDVETVIELLITRNKKLKTKYNVKNADLPIWNDETLKSFSEGLDIFEFLLTKYLKAITQKLDIVERFGSESNFLENIYNAHENSIRMRCTERASLKYFMKPEDIIELLNNPNMVINYNYTDIAKRIYKNQPNDIHVHINGQIATEFGFDPSKEGLKTNIVIGYTNHNNSDVPKELYHFEKSCRRIVKNTRFFGLKPDNDKVAPFDLLIIGHSCCTADNDIIGNLLSHKKLNNAIILCHTKDDLISINNNIKHILKPEIYYSLMTHEINKKGPSLFFAVEQLEENL